MSIRGSGERIAATVCGLSRNDRVFWFLPLLSACRARTLLLPLVQSTTHVVILSEAKNLICQNRFFVTAFLRMTMFSVFPFIFILP